MKRILPILLILLFMLSACSAAAQPGESQAGSQAESQAESRQSVASEPGPDPAATLPADSADPGAPEPVSAYPLQLLDNEVCTVTVLDAGISEIWGFTVKLRCVNKTQHAQLYVLPAVACRGWQLNTDWLMTLGAGESKESEFHVFPADLARCGLEQVDECRLHLEVQDYDSFSGEVLTDEWLVFYPTGMSPEAITPAPARTLDPTDAVLVDDERVSFTVCGVELDTLWPYNVVVSYENKTDKDLSFSWQDVTVNGTDANLWLTRVMPAGLKGSCLIYFDEETMKSNGVERVEQVNGTLVVRDPATMEVCFTQDFSYTVPTK